MLKRWYPESKVLGRKAGCFGPRRLPHSGLGPRRLLTTLPSFATVATAAILTLNLVLVLDVLAVAEG